MNKNKFGPDANGRSTDLQSDCLGSIPTVSTSPTGDSLIDFDRFDDSE